MDQEKENRPLRCACGQADARLLIRSIGVESAACFACANQAIRILVEARIEYAVYTYQ